MLMKMRNMSEISTIILIITSDPVSMSPTHLNEEVREIQEILDRCQNRDKFRVYFKVAARICDFRNAILNLRPNIVHFCGHGEKNGIILENNQRLPVLYPLKALSGLFKLCSEFVQCVILNTCFSERQAKKISNYIEYVIGMRNKIKNEASIQFAIGFYSALGNGEKIEKAFEFGCNAILEVFPNILECKIPTLKNRNKNLEQILIRDKNEDTIDLILRVESKNATLNFEVESAEKTEIVKKQLLRELNFPKADSNGYPINYFLFNKTLGNKLDDKKTLKENGVNRNHCLVFILEEDLID